LQRAVLVDRTLVGPQLDDARAALGVLAARDDVDARRIGVVGKGVGGILNGVSDNRGSVWSLKAARELLGYHPRDDVYAASR